MTTSEADAASALVRDLVAAGATLATAESLTGGLVGGAVTSVSGSSAAYRGGVVSYATDLKVSLLGVPEEVVADHGVVSAPCAEAMASGVRTVTGATYAVSTTGVAGPDRQEGHPPGTVFVGVAGPSGTTAQRLSLEGDRDGVRRATVLAALCAVSEHLAADRPGRVREDRGLR